MEWYVRAFQKYADFSGRARRREYWAFALINAVISAILGTLGQSHGLIGVLAGLFSLAILIPGLAVTFRRLHDTGKSGANILWGFLPLIGQIILLIFLLRNSDYGDNRYGPNPKGEGGAAEAGGNWG